MNGVPADRQSFRTEYRRDNGLHPVWNQTMKILINVPPLALIRFAVHDHANIFHADILVASYSMRVTSIRPGFRTVPLFLTDGTKDPHARLFVKVKVYDADGNLSDWDTDYSFQSNV